MAINSPHPQYAKKEPATVEAYQWLPEDAEHTQKVLAWLMHYHRTRFIIEPSDRENWVEAKQLIGFAHNGAGWDEYGWPGDWIVRNGPDSYSVFDNSDFQARYGKDVQDDAKF